LRESAGSGISGFGSGTAGEFGTAALSLIYCANIALRIA